MNRKHTKMLCAVMAFAALTMTACESQNGPANETQDETQITAQQENSIPLVTAPEDEPYVEPPTVPPVQLKMPTYELTYSGEMAEIITWEELTDAVGLQFFVKVEDEKYPLFTMVLNKAEGDVVQVITNSDGESVTVAFLMEVVPENLSKENEKVFCLAQDTVNDIIDSLVLK